jgi:hypothetical protein
MLKIVNLLRHIAAWLPIGSKFPTEIFVGNEEQLVITADSRHFRTHVFTALISSGLDHEVIK